jgi:hypothetical protein
MGTISSKNYYGEYYGHKKLYLEYLTHVARQNHKKIIWLAGDSTLDNKYWIKEECKAVSIYNEVLNPQISKCDICYFINKHVKEDYVCINTAVEEATLRSKEKLNESDTIIMDNMKESDVLIVSIGGNDIALKQSIDIMSHLVSYLIHKNEASLKYLIQYFFSGLQDYIKKLTSKNKPSQILILWIYYPDVNPVQSWCNNTLNILGYTKNPKIIQNLIKEIYELCISELKNPITNTFPMYKILDGNNSDDYVQRVEPSSQGGEKLAIEILKTTQLIN